jgi:MFS family permease
MAPFRRLVSSYAINELGDWIGAVALALLVFRETDDPLALTALFIASKLVPALVAPALTARLDQLGVGRTLALLYCGEAAAFAALAGLAGSEFFLPAVLALALVDGCLALTARAISRAAAAAGLEPAGLLREGNALMNIAFAGGTALGPALGGVVVSVSSIQAALLIDAGSFALIAVLLATARGLPRAKAQPQAWRRRVRAGLAYVRRSPLLSTILTAQAMALVFFATVVPIEVVYAREALDAGARGFGLLLASWGAGVVLGSLVFVAARRGSVAVLVALSTALVGVAYLALAATSALWLACLISVAGGLGNGIQWVAVMTTVQQRVEPDMQARVVALLESIGAAMPGLGFVLGGALTALATSRVAYAVAGAGVLAVLAISWLALRRATPAAALEKV